MRGKMLPVNSERYDHIASGDRDLMYEIDESKNLGQFYSLAKSIAFIDSGSDPLTVTYHGCPESPASQTS
jgi:hypothetical protein